MRKYKLPTSRSFSDTVILANGSFPKHEIPLSILQNSPYLVCCDGAVNQLLNTGMQPSVIVGDFDSLSPENRKKYKDILVIDTDQETNDLTKSVKFCKNKGINKVTILGATGKREDHALGNISLLVEYMDFMEVEMITDFGIFVPVKDISIFESFEKQQVSIFSFEKGEITTLNLKYPIENRVFSNWWQGTLNESLKNEFVIEVNSKIIVYRAF